MNLDSRFQLAMARAALWLLVGAGAVVFVAKTITGSAASLAAIDEPRAVWVALAGLLAFLAVTAYEAATGVRWTVVRWTILVLTLALGAMVGTEVVSSIVAMAIPTGLASLAALVVLAFVPQGDAKNHKMQTFATPVSGARVGGPWFGGFRLAGLALSIGLVLGVVLVEAAVARGPLGGNDPVRAPKTVRAVVNPAPYDSGTVITHDHIQAQRYTLVTQEAPDGANVRNVLLIDGNRSATRGLESTVPATTPAAETYVLFDHDAHKERLGGTASCARCHHQNVLLDRATSCSECHVDMYRASDTFDHAFHVQQYKGNDSCAKCHEGGDVPRTRAASKQCTECHRHPTPEQTVVRARLPLVDGHAAGYVDAMHGLCVTCHVAEDTARRHEQPRLARCATCHPVRPAGAGDGDLPESTTIAARPGSPALALVAPGETR